MKKCVPYQLPAENSSHCCSLTHTHTHPHTHTHTHTHTHRQRHTHTHTHTHNTHQHRDRAPHTHTHTHTHTTASVHNDPAAQRKLKPDISTGPRTALSSCCVWLPVQLEWEQLTLNQQAASRGPQQSSTAEGPTAELYSRGANSRALLQSPTAEGPTAE